jgi:hypothetical protein
MARTKGEGGKAAREAARKFLVEESEQLPKRGKIVWVSAYTWSFFFLCSLFLEYVLSDSLVLALVECFGCVLV